MKCCTRRETARQPGSLPVRGAWIEIAFAESANVSVMSLPVRGAWIEISSSASLLPARTCRSPCGERGLKLHRQNPSRRRCRSLPVRGAWIEMGKLPVAGFGDLCRSPCGERGLKCPNPCCTARRPSRRSPCGERGLKLSGSVSGASITASLPVRGAWIEIAMPGKVLLRSLSLPVRGAWIEMSRALFRSFHRPGSLPVRGAWIEIFKQVYRMCGLSVAPRAGSVD